MKDTASPLDVLLSVMLTHFRNQDYGEAVAIAKAAAPYVHPKPNAGSGSAGLETLRDEQLAELCGKSEAGAEATDGHTQKSGSVVPFRPV